MEITVQIQGLQGVEDALAQAGPKLAKASLRKALKAGAEIFTEETKTRAPVLAEATPRRKPGELRDSIDMRIDLSPKQEAGTVRIGPKYEGERKDSPGLYGMFVEFGSIHGAAQPFMRPGFDSGKEQALESFTEEMKAGVETLGKK